MADTMNLCQRQTVRLPLCSSWYVVCGLNCALVVFSVHLRVHCCGTSGLQTSLAFPILAAYGRDGFFDATHGTNQEKFQEYNYVLQDQGLRVVVAFSGLLFDNRGSTVAAFLKKAVAVMAERGHSFYPARVFMDDAAALYIGVLTVWPLTKACVCVWHIIYRHFEQTFSGYVGVHSKDMVKAITDRIWTLVLRTREEEFMDELFNTIDMVYTKLGSPYFDELSPFHPEQVKTRLLTGA